MSDTITEEEWARMRDFYQTYPADEEAVRFAVQDVPCLLNALEKVEAQSASRLVDCDRLRGERDELFRSREHTRANRESLIEKLEKAEAERDALVVQLEEIREKAQTLKEEGDWLREQLHSWQKVADQRGAENARLLKGWKDANSRVVELAQKCDRLQRLPWREIQQALRDAGINVVLQEFPDSIVATVKENIKLKSEIVRLKEIETKLGNAATAMGEQWKVAVKKNARLRETLQWLEKRIAHTGLLTKIRAALAGEPRAEVPAPLTEVEATLALSQEDEREKSTSLPEEE